ncbi:von Willebrand factor type A domain-containing protein [Cladochytrium replicatum]|nr:von Willebrand factor type A domain-containing protein [Cladochytrium replicatum]
MDFCGIIIQLPPDIRPPPSFVPGPTPGSFRLPLTSVSATATIVDMIAKVDIVQEFVNEFPEPKDDKPATNVEAKYVFPLHSSASVCSFHAVIAGKKILGVVKEKAEAKKEYEQAVEKGLKAALMESHTGDVFQTSVGNIPPNSKATVHISYVTELEQDGENDSLRFIFPASIAPRYGTSSIQFGKTEHRLSIKVGCAMSCGPITSISSPSHTIQMFLGQSLDQPANSEPDMRLARVELTSADISLEKDFVVVISAANLDKPRCVLEPNGPDSYAAMLTLTPRFALKPVRSEIIFLVDRSGSMGGAKIEQTRSALQMFLRSIPPRSYFNIIGFGSSTQNLFPTSMEYTQDTLKKASTHAGKIDADLGGTEIYDALSEAFSLRRKDMPTQVIILTDGEAWDVNRIVQYVAEQVKDGKKNGGLNFARLFALGIGDEVSSALVNAMARAGEGYAQFAAVGERMEKKIVKMLKNCLTPPMTDLKVDWGVKEEELKEEDFELVEADAGDEKKKPISLFSEDTAVEEKPDDLKLPVPKLQRAPHRIPVLYPGNRFVVFAIVNNQKDRPTVVKILGSSTDGPVELSVPVISFLKAFSSAGEGSKFGLIHTLAARKLIQDLDEGKSYLHDEATNPFAAKMPGPIPADVVHHEIVRLGVTYGLASSATSFVAVEEETDGTKGKKANSKVLWVPGPTHTIETTEEVVEFRTYGGSPARPLMASFQPMMRMSMAAPSAKLTSYASAAPPPPAPAPGGAFLTAAPVMNAQSAPVNKKSKRAFFGGLGSALGGLSRESKGSLDKLEAKESAMDDEDAILQAAVVVGTDKASNLSQLVLLQNFDGSFPESNNMTDILSAIIGDGVRLSNAYKKAGGVGADVWTTAIVVAVLRRWAGELKDEWELIVEKAIGYLAGADGGGDSEGVVEKAAKALE